MVRNAVIPPQSFDEILAWLDPDRDVAGEMYVQLRRHLTKIFSWNHCSDPEGLTDEVMDRVARKIHQVRPTYEGDPRLYFYGIARNLIKENPKRARFQVSLEDVDLPAIPAADDIDDRSMIREDCLQSCLQQLGSEKRDLIVAYYAKEKQAKIDHRLHLAQQLGISLQSLRVRSYRIRATLEDCIEKCLRHRMETK